MLSFKSYFPENAENETFSITFSKDNEFQLPAGTYRFEEYYCSVPGCDCRVCNIHIFTNWSSKRVAELRYGWESLEFYKNWLENDDPDYEITDDDARVFVGVSLHHTAPHRLSLSLKKVFERQLRDLPDLSERLQRHDAIVRKAVEADAEKTGRSVKRLLGGTTLTRPMPKKKKETFPEPIVLPKNFRIENTVSPETVKAALLSPYEAVRNAAASYFDGFSLDGSGIDGVMQEIVKAVERFGYEHCLDLLEDRKYPQDASTVAWIVAELSKDFDPEDIPSDNYRLFLTEMLLTVEPALLSEDMPQLPGFAQERTEDFLQRLELSRLDDEQLWKAFVEEEWQGKYIDEDFAKEEIARRPDTFKPIVMEVLTTKNPFVSGCFVEELRPRLIDLIGAMRLTEALPLLDRWIHEDEKGRDALPTGAIDECRSALAKIADEGTLDLYKKRWMERPHKHVWFRDVLAELKTPWSLQCALEVLQRKRLDADTREFAISHLLDHFATETFSLLLPYDPELTTAQSCRQPYVVGQLVNPTVPFAQFDEWKIEAEEMDWNLSGVHERLYYERLRDVYAEDNEDDDDEVSWSDDEDDWDDDEPDEDDDGLGDDDPDEDDEEEEEEHYEEDDLDGYDGWDEEDDDKPYSIYNEKTFPIERCSANLQEMCRNFERPPHYVGHPGKPIDYRREYSLSETDIPALLEIAAWIGRDEESRGEFFSAPFHAWEALSQFEPSLVVPDILKLLDRLDWYEVDHEFDTNWAILEHLGKEAARNSRDDLVSLMFEAMQEPSRHDMARQVILLSLENIRCDYKQFDEPLQKVLFNDLERLEIGRPDWYASIVAALASGDDPPGNDSCEETASLLTKACRGGYVALPRIKDCESLLDMTDLDFDKDPELKKLVEEFDIVQNVLTAFRNCDCTFPRKAVLQAREYRDRMIPALIEEVRNATAYARNDVETPDGTVQFAVHLLGEFQAKEALAVVLDSLSITEDQSYDFLYGEGTFESMYGILYRLIGDDLEFFDLRLRDKTTATLLRCRLLQALPYLVKSETISEEKYWNLLEDYLEIAIEEQNVKFTTDVVCDLCHSSDTRFLPLVRKAFARKLVDTSMVSETHIVDELQGNPKFGPVKSMEYRLRHLKGDFDDTVKQLGSWAWFQPAPIATKTKSALAPNEAITEKAGEESSVSRLSATTKVGRNDPCPCGSGKKYKKCCGK